MTARCERTELPADQCACPDHRGDPQPRADATTAGLGWFDARYPGVCAECGEPFDVGTPITYDRRSGDYVARCCAFTGSD